MEFSLEKIGERLISGMGCCAALFSILPILLILFFLKLVFFKLFILQKIFVQYDEEREVHGTIEGKL